MNFFDLSDGKSATETGTEFSANEDLKPIPENTTVEAIIESAKWDESDFVDGKFINIKWSVLKPSDYENRKIFHKVKVFDSKTSVSDKAKRMLAAIDANAGGKLSAIGKEPTDEDLSRALESRIMVLKLGAWEMKDEAGNVTNEGNWVKAISPRGTPGAASSAQLLKPGGESLTPKPKVSLDEDIDF